MTTPTVLAGAEVVPYTPDAPGHRPPYIAAGTPLPDGTALLAWLSLDAIVVRHYTRDLGTVLAETTTPVLTGDGIGLWVGTDGTPVLADATRSWTITTTPLALTPGPGHAPVEWFWARGQTVTGDATVLLGNSQLIVHRPGQALTVHAITDDVSAVHPGPKPGTAYISATGWQAEVATLHVIDLATGATTTVPDVTTSAAWQSYTGPVAVPAWAWLAMEPDTTTGWSSLVLRDATGDLVDSLPWPAAPAYLHASIAAATTPDGALAAIFYGTQAGASGVGLAHATTTGADVTDLPLPTTTHVQGTTTDAAPVVTVHGRTALVLVVGYQRASDTGLPHNTFGLTAWTIDLGGAEGILDVPTVADGWWTIGTQDPAMAWEFLVPTPRGWMVEIVAGEESQATHEFCVPAPLHPLAGDDGWVVVALMRPDTT